MLKRTLFVLVLGLMVAGPGWTHDPNHVEGSGVIISEQRDVAVFTEVELEGAFTTEITCQEKPLLEIRGDDNIVPLIKTEVRAGVLRVYSQKSFSTRKLLKVTIGMHALEKLTVSGANDVVVSKVKGDQLQVEAGGSSTITISGKVERLGSELSGAATLHAGKLEAEAVVVNIGGAGNADVYATQSLDAQIMGAGSVSYGGKPKEVSRQILGAGSIEPR